MRPSMMDFDLLLQLASAKVGSAIEDIENAIAGAPPRVNVDRWREVKDCLHDAHEQLRKVEL